MIRVTVFFIANGHQSSSENYAGDISDSLDVCDHPLNGEELRDNSQLGISSITKGLLVSDLAAL
jgi:hypothetical protein